MSKQLRLDVAQLTDVGRKRPHNEDNMAYVIPKDSQVMAKKGALFIVADGMGGHAAGEVASEIAVDTVSNAYYQDENDDIPLSLMNAIKKANALIHQRAAENMLRSGMGTTCVAAVLCDSVAYIANVGDSRAYMVRNGQSRQISQDHSWVEEQVRAGLLTKDQARSHAQRNVITRCLGTQSDVEVDVFSETLHEGDTFILCSDGLSGSVIEDELRSIINQYLPQESVYHLVERANENGGPDNITAIVVRVQEVGDEMPGALYPVHAGSGHVADESTATLGNMPTAALSTAAPVHTEDSRSSSALLQAAPDQHFSSAGSVTAPQAAVKVPRRKRSRLVVPTVAICLLLLLALASSGYYFFFHPSSDQVALDQANGFLGQAKNNISSNPSQALQELSHAQAQLHAVNAEALNASQSAQLHDLRSTLVTDVQQSVTNYNRQASISALPCKKSNPVALNVPNAHDVQFSTTALITDSKGHTLTYTLGSDGQLYQIGDNHAITNANLKTDKIVALTNSAQSLYVLTTAQRQGGLSYTLHIYKPDTNGKLTEDATKGTTIQSNLIDEQTPQLMTAWGNDIYVISTSNQANQYQATILNYQADKLNTPPQQAKISISAGLVSAAALPGNQLFLLHSDGYIKELQFNPVHASVESDMVVKGDILTPWSVDAKSFTAATPVATPTADINKFLVLPAPSSQQTQSLMTSAQINKVPHLYVVDNTNHRVLDLLVSGNGAALSSVTPTPTAANGNTQASSTPPSVTTPSNVGGNVIGSSNNASVQLAQQYASPTVLPMVRSIAVTPGANNTNQLNLLTGEKNATSVNQVAINVSSNTACTPTS